MQRTKKSAAMRLRFILFIHPLRVAESFLVQEVGVVVQSVLYGLRERAPLMYLQPIIKIDELLVVLRASGTRIHCCLLQLHRFVSSFR